MVDASAVHGLCGLWGMIATGLFTTKEAYGRAYDEVRKGPRNAMQGCFCLLHMLAVAGALIILHDKEKKNLLARNSRKNRNSNMHEDGVGFLLRAKTIFRLFV